MTDSVNGVVATTTAQQSSAGITFTGNTQYINMFGQKYDIRDKTIQIDIGAMTASPAPTGHARLLCYTANSNLSVPTNTSAFMWRYKDSIGWTFYTGSGWESSLDNSVYTQDYFANKTVSVYYDENRVPTVYVDTTKIVTFANGSTITDGYLIIGGTGTDKLYQLGIVVKAIRIYDGEVV
jgi:hypothetical protein